MSAPDNYYGPALCIDLWIERLPASDIPYVLRQIAKHINDQGGHGSGVYFKGRLVGRLLTAVRVEDKPRPGPSPN